MPVKKSLNTGSAKRSGLYLDDPTWEWYVEMGSGSPSAGARYAMALIDDLAAKLFAVQHENNRLRAALAEYANEANWSIDMWKKDTYGCTAAKKALEEMSDGPR